MRVNWEAVRGREWAYREPPALVPVPAADVRPLTGRRLIIHDPTLRGWNDSFIAASEPHQYEGRTHVGIMSAADWYRRRDDPGHIVVPRPMPIDLLWVETQVEVPTDDQPVLAPVDQSEVPKNAGPAKRIVDPDQPPVRRLRRALGEATVHGRRAALNCKDRPMWPVRVCSEPFLDELPDVINMTGGLDDFDEPLIGPVVTLCSESSWHRWTWSGEPPARAVPKPLYRVWVL